VCSLCQRAVLVKPKNCNGEPAFVDMKEYVGEGLCHDCFLQGRGMNDGLNNGDKGTMGTTGMGAAVKGASPLHWVGSYS
jgi:hypothetical protein